MAILYSLRIMLCLSGLLFSLSAWSQASFEGADKKLTFFQSLQKEQITNVSLATNFSKLCAEKNQGHELDALMSWENAEGETETMALKISLRGKNRRHMCDMPPLRLNFPKKELEKRGYSKKGDKLKVVTHCMESAENEQLVLKEFWTYRLYNEMVPFSFQAHLLKIRYIDTALPKERQESEAMMGFMIESKEELAKRFDGKDEDIWGLTPDEVEQASYQSTVLFQYMIGNEDWDLSMRRNVAFIQPKNGGLPLLVPYDFDFSGLVDAPYAVPKISAGATSVQDRIVMGKFESRDDLLDAIDLLLTLREKDFRCFEDCSYLSDSSKKSMNRYLDSFFKKLVNTKRMERMFLSD